MSVVRESAHIVAPSPVHGGADRRAPPPLQRGLTFESFSRDLSARQVFRLGLGRRSTPRQNSHSRPNNQVYRHHAAQVPSWKFIFSRGKLDGGEGKFQMGGSLILLDTQRIDSLIEKRKEVSAWCSVKFSDPIRHSCFVIDIPRIFNLTNLINPIF